jgi:uncharacterized protein YegP (UPF0339 family)
MATAKSYKLVIWSKTPTQWYWRIKAPNGKIVADGSEAYKTKKGAVRAADSLTGAFLSGRVVLMFDIARPEALLPQPRLVRATRAKTP